MLHSIPHQKRIYRKGSMAPVEVAINISKKHLKSPHDDIMPVFLLNWSLKASKNASTSHGWNFHWKKHVGTKFFMSITGRFPDGRLSTDGGQHPNLPTNIEEISWQSWNFSISDLHLPRETTGCTGSTGRKLHNFVYKKLTKPLGEEWENKNSFTIVSHHTTKNITVMCGKHSSSSDFFDTKLLLKIFSSCGLRSRP